MIEYLATAGAVGFAWTTIAWQNTGVPLSAAWPSQPGWSGCW